MSVNVDFDTRGFISALKDFAAVTKKDAKQALRDEMRLFVQRLIELTPPAHGRGSAAAARQLGEKAVESDLSRLYRNPDLLVDWIHSQPIADKVKKAIAAGNLAAVRAILKNINAYGGRADIQSGPSSSTHEAERNNRGRVRKGAAPILILNGRSLKNYIAEIKKHVGRAKAGWVSASVKFKSRSIPAWVSRHGSGDGSSSERETVDTLTLEAINRNKAIGNLNSESGIVSSAIGGRERDIRSKLQRIMDYQADRFSRH